MQHLNRPVKQHSGHIPINDFQDIGVLINRGYQGSVYYAVNLNEGSHRLQRWRINRVTKTGHIVIEPRIFSSLDDAKAFVSKRVRKSETDNFLSLFGEQQFYCRN